MQAEGQRPPHSLLTFTVKGCKLEHKRRHAFLQHQPPALTSLVCLNVFVLRTVSKALEKVTSVHFIGEHKAECHRFAVLYSESKPQGLISKRRSHGVHFKDEQHKG